MVIFDYIVISIIIASVVREKPEELLPLVSVGGGILFYALDVLKLFWATPLLLTLVTVVSMGYGLFRIKKIHSYREVLKSHGEYLLFFGVFVMIFLGFYIGEFTEDHGSNGNGGLLLSFIKVYSLSVIGDNYGVMFAARLSFLLCLIAPLLFALFNNGYKKRIEKISKNLAGVALVLILFSSTDNEFASIKPFMIIGVMLGMALYYWDFSLAKSPKTIGKITIMLVGACLCHRVGYVITASFLLGVIVCKSVRRILLWADKRRTTHAILMLLFPLIGMIITLLIREWILCRDPFSKDVSDTFLSSLITTRRYHFGLFQNVSYIHFILLGFLLFFILGYLALRDNRPFGMLLSVYQEANVISAVYVVILWGLYVIKFAHENIEKGEYLTKFENYIQIPVVFLLVFIASILANLANEGENSIR